MARFGDTSIFYVFAVFCVLAILIVALFIPETKGITLEELEFNQKKEFGCAISAEDKTGMPLA